ncbi:MAG TPA: hypothetical protein VFS67_30815, partial [Polyangiaceae bacterium]|nr:hypothetical protein [Polyangiaceae bacterium]
LRPSLKTPLRAHAALIADFCPDGKRSEKMERYGSLTRASTHQRLPASEVRATVLGWDPPASSRMAVNLAGRVVAKLEKGNDSTPPISSDRLDEYLRTHLIDPAHLRADAFDKFMADRQQQLLQLIEAAMGKPAHGGVVREEALEEETDEETVEAELTIAAE